MTRDEINNLKLRVKLFSNENRRLKRKFNSSVQSEVVEQSEDSSSSTDPESALLANLPPSAKSRARKRLSLHSPANIVKRKFRLDRINL